MDNPRLPKHALNYNLEEEEIRDAPGNDGNASMPEQVKRLNAWSKRRMMKEVPLNIIRKIVELITCFKVCSFHTDKNVYENSQP
jgi:hypothetical protein